MKVGIITFHFPYNCGAVLQCYALKRVLEEKGHTVSVINYRPPYHQNRYTPYKNPFISARVRILDFPENASLAFKVKSVTGGFYKAMLTWRNLPENKKQDDMFKNFTRDHLNETRKYRSLKMLKHCYPPFDIYISGSDQLWNPYITEGKFDEAYFLKFGRKETIRVTYAVGANFDTYPDVESVLPQLLKDIDAISLREEKCLETVKKCAPHLQPVISVDPTLLLEKDAYHELIPDTSLEKEHFILTYTMPDSSQRKVNETAKKLASKTGLKVIDACGQPLMGNREIEDNRKCGPSEFLWYMERADYVLTNSFHGTAFSVIMEKQFFVIPHSKTGNRAIGLLEKMGVGDRWTYDPQQVLERITEKIDYKKVNCKKEVVKEESLRYLDKCMEIKK